MAKDFTSTERLKKVLPEFEFLITLIPIPGPGNLIVVYDTPGDVKVACITEKDQVIFDLSATTIAPIAKQ